MQEMLRRMRHRGDAGLSPPEVVIAMFVFAIVSIAVVHSLTAVLTVTRDSRNREIASNLASQEIDLARDAANIFGLFSGQQDRRAPQRRESSGLLLHHAVGELDGLVHGPVRSGWRPAAVQEDQHHRDLGAHASRLGARLRQHGHQPEHPHQQPADGHDPRLGARCGRQRRSGRHGLGSSRVASQRRADHPGIPSPTDFDGCTYILQVTPGDYTVTVSKANYIFASQSVTATQAVTVAANTAASASFTYDLRARYQLAYYSSPAPFAMIPSDLETSFYNERGEVYVNATMIPSFARNIDRFPWEPGLHDLRGQVCRAERGDGGCLSPAPSSGRTGPSANSPSPASTRFRSRQLRAGTCRQSCRRRSSRYPASTGQGQVSAGRERHARTGRPGCALGMTYKTNQVPSSSVWLALPTHLAARGERQLRRPGAPLNSGMPVVTQGQMVTGSTFMLDPRTPA